MEAFFANQSCDPFTPQSTPCQLGNYVSYAVNVSNTQDVQTALLFARAANIRVVVRNTGHEYVCLFFLISDIFWFDFTRCQAQQASFPPCYAHVALPRESLKSKSRQA